MKKILTLTIVLIMLLLMVLPSFAAIDSELPLYPTSLPLRSGYVNIPDNVIVYEVIFLDKVERFAQTLNYLTQTPFRYRLANGIETAYLTNFSVVSVNSYTWRIVADDGITNGLTVFTITSVDSTTISNNDVQFVCTLDGMYTGNNVPTVLNMLETHFYYGICPSILPFISSNAECPTLPGLLSTYDGTFDSIVEMLNPTNAAEYTEEMNAAFNRGLTVGGSKVYGHNIIGDTLSAPFAAMNELTIVTTPMGTITLADVVSTVIVIMLVILFLKLFAGG